MNLSASAYFLIASNIFPLFFVFFDNWRLDYILTLYWAESAIIGFFNIFKIIYSEKMKEGRIPDKFFDSPKVRLIGKIFLAAFFTVHFGGFMVGHGVFLFGLVLSSDMKTGPGQVLFMLAQIKWAFLALFLSHGYSFYFNYMKSGERFNTTADEAMSSPYSRIIVMHITILIGAFLMMALSANYMFLIVFSLMKLFFDLKGHLKEREKFGFISKTQ